MDKKTVLLFKALVEDYEILVMDLEIKADSVFQDRRIMISEADEYLRVALLKVT